MKKLTYWAGAVAITANLAAPFVASSIASATSHATYALGTAKKCKTGFIKKTERHKVSVTVKVNGKSVTKKVTRRYIACVWVVPKIVVPPATAAAPTATVPAQTSTAPTSSPTTTATTPVVTTVRASIDPSWVLAVKTPQSPPVPVTFTYSAADSAGTLPNGELTLAIYVHASVSSAGGCQANVGGAMYQSTCTVSLPGWGRYDLITSYSSGVSNVASTGDTETVNVEPPAPSPETIVETWGTTLPTNGPAITADVVGLTATVTLNDANFEGATSVGITDQLGDQCAASVVGTMATCDMTVTGRPNAFTVAYPGGPDQVTTQTVSPWGTTQSQTVTYQWPSENVAVSNPTVTSQSATVLWNGGHRLNSNGSGFGTWSGTPSDPITLSQGQGVSIDAYASGSLSADQYPLGAISYTVGPVGGVTMTDGQPASSSANCSGSYNYSGEAVGVCNIMFTSTGTYTITIGFVSSDNNYSSSAADALTETVIVS